MPLLLAILVGILYACGLYLMMRRSIVKLIIGLALLTHAANLLILASGGLTRGGTPVVPRGMTEPQKEIADPLPQALILTAIVISFGVMAFSIVLVHRVHRVVGTDDLGQMTATDT